jgi:nicotinate-nucleotide adenylyltransferase
MKSGKRIGIMGGTFDPPHLGHLIPVEEAAKQFALDLVWYVPAYIPPHKQSANRTDPFHRAAMLTHALVSYPKFLFTPLELLEGTVSYTVDTLRKFKEGIEPEDRLFFVMGADSFLEISTWHQYDQLLAICDLIIINRGQREEELRVNLELLQKQLRFDLEASVHFASSPYLPISSTDIRVAVQEGKTISHLVPAEVDTYIQKYSLYQRR